jgi:hypothetical protein
MVTGIIPTLNMETVGSHETLVTIKWTTQCYIRENYDYNLSIDHRQKLECQIRSLHGSETFILCFSVSGMDATRLTIHGSERVISDRGKSTWDVERDFWGRIYRE